MSAFVVSRSHITVLVQAAHDCAEHNRSGVFNWFTGSHATEDVKRHEMSTTAEDSDRVGAMLLAENVASVNARYRENDAPEAFTFSVTGCHNTDPVAVLKAIDCYEYQACEHAGWGTSSARAFCDSLRKQTIKRLTGYSESPGWSVEDGGERTMTRDGAAAVRAKEAKRARAYGG